MSNNDIWIIFDVNALALHSLHSGKDSDAITLSNGKSINSPMHSVMNFTDRYLMPALETVPAARIIGVRDAGRSYRTSFYPNYKGGRVSDEEERGVMSEAVSSCFHLLNNLGIACCDLAGEEADDVIAYLNNNLPGTKLIYTLDKDLIALASDTTLVFLQDNPQTHLVDKDVVVEPQYVTLYKSLVGDTSDNYLGVPGFGPAAWKGLVELHSAGVFTLDKLNNIAEHFLNIVDSVPVTALGKAEFLELKELANTHKVLAKIVNETIISEDSEVLREGIACKGLKYSVGAWVIGYRLAKLNPGLVDARVAHKLIDTIRTTSEFEPSRRVKSFNRLNWIKHVPNKDVVRKLLGQTRGGFPEYANTFDALYPSQYLVKAGSFKPESLENLKKSFKSSRIIGLDWETWAEPNANFKAAVTKGDYVDMFGSKISGMGITYGRNLEKTLYFQFDHSDTENNINKDHLLSILELMPDTVPVVIQNALFENSVLLAEFGVQFEGMYDTKIMHSHIDEESSSGLKDLSKRYLRYSQMRYEDVIEKGKTMRDYTGQHVFKYGADDPLVTSHLFDLFYIILNLEGTWEFVRDYEFPVVNLLAESFTKGVSIDWEALSNQHKEDIGINRDNIKKIRDLLKENQAVKELEERANHKFETEIKWDWDTKKNQIKSSLETLFKQNGLITPAEFKELAPFIAKGMVDGFFDSSDNISVESLMGFYEQEEAAHINLFKRDLAKSYVYEDYVETPIPVKFTATQLGRLADALGISRELYSAIKDVIKEVDSVYAISTTVGVDRFTPEQEKFLTLWLGYAQAKTPSKSDQYQHLKDWFESLNITKVEATGKELNLNSPVQMKELFYGMLGMPVRVKSFDTNLPQANEVATEEALAWEDAIGWKAEVLKALLKAKKADTRIKLFYSKFPLWRHPNDGMIHPQFNSVGTESRRPTGSSPNLLQLSKKGDGVKVRRCILPNEKMGHNLIGSIDWDGEELRVIAGVSGDKELTSCYVGNQLKDVHSIVAAQMVKVSYEEFVAVRKGSQGADAAKAYDNVRKVAKSVVFGGNYGIGAAKLSKTLHCTEAEARDFLQAKKDAYYGMEQWKEQVKKELRETGYVSTLLGSRKHVFDSVLGEHGSAYERSAVNYLIQGLCADYLKMVLSTLWKRRTFQRHKAVMIAPIYDEIVFSCHDSQAVSLIKEIYSVMTGGIPGFPIPLLANPSVGVNFGGQEEVLVDCNQKLTDDLIQQAIDKVLGKSK